MRATTFCSLTLLSLALPFTALAEPHAKAHVNRHHDIAVRARGDVELKKRTTNARWTYYDVGLGACGQTNVASDFIVALNSNEYGSGYPGPNCFKMITMTYNGKTTTAQIMDECPGCPTGGLDLSEGLFQYFADLGEGVLYGTWTYNDDSSAATTTSVYVAPTTTKKATTTKATTTWTPEPTTTWTPDPTTTTHKTTSTSTYIWVEPTTSKTSTTSKQTTSSSVWSSSSSSVWSSSSSSSSSVYTPTSSSYSSAAPLISIAVSASIDYSSGVASGLAVPTGTVSAASSTDPENLDGFNQAIINLGGLVAAGAQII